MVLAMRVSEIPEVKRRGIKVEKRREGEEKRRGEEERRGVEE